MGIGDVCTHDGTGDYQGQEAEHASGDLFFEANADGAHKKAHDIAG